MLRFNLLSVLKSTGCQWWPCQSAVLWQMSVKLNGSELWVHGLLEDTRPSWSLELGVVKKIHLKLSSIMVGNASIALQLQLWSDIDSFISKCESRLGMMRYDFLKRSFQLCENKRQKNILSHWTEWRSQEKSINIPKLPPWLSWKITQPCFGVEKCLKGWYEARQV